MEDLTGVLGCVEGLDRCSGVCVEELTGILGVMDLSGVELTSILCVVWI